MPDSESLCARCARYTQTCCQWRDIFVTLGDVRRIEQFSARRDFVERRAPDDGAYLDQDEDPTWREQTVFADGTRRILRRQPNGDCVFLGGQGCTLPPQVRPLVCRLYPFDYTADGIRADPVPGCPLELLSPGQELLAALDMKLADARRWHEQLYREIRPVADPV